jgi:pyruvate dehydrogenase E1 component
VIPAAALRRHFEVDAESIALAALSSLAQDGRLEAARVTQAMQDLGYDPEKIDPMAI